MPENEFECDVTAVLTKPTEEELAWAEVMARQRAKTRDLRAGGEK